MPKDDRFPLALSKGTILSGQYVIERVLGQGGFGITYKAVDYRNGNKPVAVKEYFPDSLVYREMSEVIPYPGDRAENFEYGKKNFLAEAETLARFLGNDNIVRVYSYFEENGTAYFAMEYVDGIPFDKYLQTKPGGRITIDEAKKILIPVMDALGAVHAKGIIHRDVTPDNIYITNTRVMLLDFGAARYSLGDKSQSLDVVLKHGFAPKEQYQRKGKQGPFTDIYSLGATFYFAITGRRPPDSIDRIDTDQLIPPSRLGVNITKYQETAILQAMSVRPEERFRSMAEFKSVLLNDRSRPISPPVKPPPIPAANITGVNNVKAPPADKKATTQELQNRLKRLQTRMSQIQMEIQQQEGAAQMPQQPAAVNRAIPSQIQMPVQPAAVNRTIPSQIQMPVQPAAANRTIPSQIQMPVQPAAVNRTIPSQIQMPVQPAAYQPIPSQIQITPQPMAGVVQPPGTGNNYMVQPIAAVTGVSQTGTGISPSGSGVSTIPSSGSSPVQPVAASSQPEYSAPKKSNNKGLILGIVAICAVMVIAIGVIILVAGSSGKNKSPSGGGGMGYADIGVSSDESSKPFVPKNTSSATNSGTHSNPFTNTPSVVSKPVVSPPPVNDGNFSAADLEIVGNTAANITNFGCYTTTGLSRFWIDEDYHSVKTDVTGKETYIHKNFKGEFSCLSYTGGYLYYIYDKQAYRLDVTNDSDHELVPGVQGLKNIDRFFVTNSFFFVYQDGKLYRINRKSEKIEETIEIQYGDQFTLAKGCLYYISAAQDGRSCVYKVSADNFTKVEDTYKAENGFFRSPMVYEDYLYIFHVADGDETKTELSRISAANSGGKWESWVIGNFLAKDKSEYAYEMNMIGENIFFSVQNNSTSKSSLYHIVLADNGHYDASKIADSDSAHACVSKQGEDYKVNYIEYDAAKKQYINRSAVYDHKTNKKK